MKSDPEEYIQKECFIKHFKIQKGKILENLMPEEYFQLTLFLCSLLNFFFRISTFNSNHFPLEIRQESEQRNPSLGLS